MNIKENGDAIFEDGHLTAVSTKQDIVQNLLSIFNTRKGEFFLDINYGLDYKYLEAKGSSDDEIISDLLDAIEQEERVTEIISIDIKRLAAERKVLIDIVLKTKVGIIEMREVDLFVRNK